MSLRDLLNSSKSLSMSVMGLLGVGMNSRPFCKTECCSGVRGCEERFRVG